MKSISDDKNLRAYVVGASLGDGNLSNPNGKAVRLRITCDNKYPKIIDLLSNSLRELFPDNKVSFIKRNNCVDISCYSNYLEDLLGWKALGGPKSKQNLHIPCWIKNDNEAMKYCLLGLFQTDGSIYYDRGYLMVNFVNNSLSLTQDVIYGISKLGFSCTLNVNQKIGGNKKYTVRIVRESKKFIDCIRLFKN